MAIESGSITKKMTTVVQGIDCSAPSKNEGIVVHLTYKGVVRDKTLWIQSSGRAPFTNGARKKCDLDFKVPTHTAELYREDACILKLCYNLRLCFFQFPLLKGSLLLPNC